MVYLLDRITRNPDQCGGRPCIRGLRIRVADVLDLLAAGESAEEILAEYPNLEAADIGACLQYAALRLDSPDLGGMTGRPELSKKRVPLSEFFRNSPLEGLDLARDRAPRGTEVPR